MLSPTLRYVTGSSQVDLSRLPAPTVVEQLSFEAIFDEAVAKVRELLPAFDATVDSDPAVKVLQVLCYREMLLRQQFNDRARSIMVGYATGADLDNLAALFGVARLTIVEADELAGVEAVLEGDEELRRRVVLAPEAYTVAGPELAYVWHALSAHPDVADATATSPTPGEVVVAVLGREGDGTPTLEALEAVELRVNSRTVRPLTDLVQVLPAEVVPFSVAAEIFTFHGPDAMLIVDAAKASLEAFLETNRRLGRDLTFSGLYSALHVAGVQRVTLSSPVAPIECEPTQVAHCTAIAVEFGGYDN